MSGKSLMLTLFFPIPGEAVEELEVRFHYRSEMRCGSNKSVQSGLSPERLNLDSIQSYSHDASMP